jgi:UDP-N-acetylglucosamine--N-acetylmuramyl-(pentapeptide) pyrophosphoryl-undecaprenol N-acetylglucosamine transferase
MKVVFGCGGTGGHVFPAVAIAEQFIKHYNAEVSFIGRANSLEERWVAKDYNYDSIQAVPLQRGKIAENLLLPFRLLRSVLQALKALRKSNADAVVTTGGYVSLPTILAAAILRIPVYIQEQNAVPGVANRIGAYFAQKVFVTSPEAAAAFSGRLAENLGNPVRSMENVEELEMDIPLQEGQKLILALGGSQGALGINKKLLAILDKIAQEKNWVLMWQVGEKNYEEIQAQAPQSDNVYIRPFLDNVYAYLRESSVVISRAGASSLAEILAFAKPSVLLPFPYATANHQEHNARAVERQGAAMVELDSDENGLWEKLSQLLENDTLSSKMRRAAGALGVRDAGEKIARRIVSLESLK